PPGSEAQSDQLYSIGALVKTDGTITDVLPGSPAYDAGLGPHMTILAVDNRTFSVENLVSAIAHPSNGTIAVTVRNFDSVLTHDIRYGGGLRYPHLARIPDSQDDLTTMLEPRTVD